MGPIPGQSGTGSNGSKEVLHIPQNSRTGVSSPDCLDTYKNRLFSLIIIVMTDY